MSKSPIILRLLIAMNEHGRRSRTVVGQSLLSRGTNEQHLIVMGTHGHRGKDILKNARALAARHGAKAEAILRKTEGGRVRDVIVVEAHEWRADPKDANKVRELVIASTCRARCSSTT